MQVIAANWQAPSNIHALTTVRPDGVSEPPFNSLNLADHVGDNAAAVAKNRQLIASQLELPSAPVWLTQTHSTRILCLGNDSPTAALDTAVDGVFTQQRGKVCVIMTADCLPLLLCNVSGTKIAALHAGWRGLADGIIEQGLALFDEPAEHILAYAGPCISKKHFEVGLEVREELGGSDSAYAFEAAPGKCYADLYALAGERLANLGVTQYSHTQHCSFAERDLFFSYRRDGQCGRMASFIWID